MKEVVYKKKKKTVMGFNEDWYDQNNKQISLDSLLVKYKDKSISYKSIYDEGEYQGVQITIKFIDVKTPELAEVKNVCSKHIYYSHTVNYTSAKD